MERALEWEGLFYFFFRLNPAQHKLHRLASLVLVARVHLAVFLFVTTPKKHIAMASSKLFSLSHIGTRLSDANCDACCLLSLRLYIRWLMLFVDRAPSLLKFSDSEAPAAE